MKPIEAQRKLRQRIQERRNEALDRLEPFDGKHPVLDKVYGRKFLHVGPFSFFQGGRNKPCKCGSGKKHKYCCLNKAV